MLDMRSVSYTRRSHIWTSVRSVTRFLGIRRKKSAQGSHIWVNGNLPVQVKSCHMSYIYISVWPDDLHYRHYDGIKSYEISSKATMASGKGHGLLNKNTSNSREDDEPIGTYCCFYGLTLNHMQEMEKCNTSITLPCINEMWMQHLKPPICMMSQLLF